MDLPNDTVSIVIWMAAAAAVATGVLTMLVRHIGSKPQIAAVGAAALLAAILVAAPWLWLYRTAVNRPGSQEAAVAAGARAAERRAIESRLTELTVSVTMPGAPLACLDALAGEPVASACEQAVFASPVSVAGAVSYAAARLRLLVDGVAYARRLDPAYEASLADLRMAVEKDAFGIYSHVLAQHGCTPEQCAAFALLRDTTNLKAHLRQGVYATYVAQHRDRWGLFARASTAVPPAAAMPGPPAAALTATRATAVSTATGAPPMPRVRPTAAMAATIEAETVSLGSHSPTAEVAPAEAEVPAGWVRGVVPPAASILPNIDFPSAASIPPVSIMAAEPKLPPIDAASAPPSTAPKSSPRPQ